MKKLIFLIGLFYLTICSFGQIKVTTGSVNLRVSPEVKENKICVIVKGSTVTIVHDSVVNENWSKVNYNGRIGFVNNAYLKNIDTESNSKNYKYNNNSTDKGVKYYKNSKGEKVQSPTYYNSAPDGATAECNDGTYSFSRSRRGTCSHHGGVKRWLK